MEHKFKKFSKKDIILIALAIIVLGWAIFFYINKKSEPKLPPITYAEKGEIVQGFPTEFWREEGVEIRESYSLDYGEAKQPVIYYESNMSMQENMETFGEYLQIFSWNLLNSSSSEDLSFLYAEKENDNVNITIIKNDEGKIVVTIAYLDRDEKLY